MRSSWNDKRFPFNNRGESHFFDQIAYWSTHGLVDLFTGGSKGADPPAAVAPPDPNKAAQDALDAQNKDRRALLASGGKTDLTGGSGMLLGSDINSLNVGGS